MRTILALFTLLTIFQTLPWVSNGTPIQLSSRTVFDDELREVVELVRLQMVCGYAGIPPLAPYQEEHRQIVLKTSTIE